MSINQGDSRHPLCANFLPNHLLVKIWPKNKLKVDLKPLKCKHHSVGSKEANSLLTRLRTGKHYLLDCFLYSAERQTLYSQVEHYIRNFTHIS